MAIKDRQDVNASAEGSAGQGQRDFIFTDRDFRKVCELIRDRVGIALTDAKRDMVYSRLSRRLRALGFVHFENYLDELDDSSSTEWEHFTNALTTNLTSFFREPHHFEVLHEQLSKLKHSHQGIINIWCCAASTGEEPYSILMTACEVFNTLKPPVKLWATDVDTQVLATAARGVYSLDRITELSNERKRHFFKRGTGSNAGLCRVHPALQTLVEFDQLNLLDPGYRQTPLFDAVFCRNVMIYFEKPTQREILRKLVTKMAPDSLLYTGHSENYIHAADIIAPCGRTLYRRADSASGGKRQ